jgi:YHS domain-containing protein/uncharacterized membrane protein/mono/diheme cytochrome c family protein
VLFFGRFHPALVHLPIGLLVLLGFLELLARFDRFKQANANAGLILALAAPLAVLTAAFGWMLSQGGGYDGELLRWHRWTGVGTAAACVLAAILYAANARRLYRGVLVLGLGALVVSSHFGGSLTHGSDYLTRYAPPQLRDLFRGKRPSAPAPKPEQPVDEGAAFFSTAIAPLLNDKCVACHGPEKSKGGLRLDSFEALTKGGDTGLAIVPGKSGEGTMVKRMLLPLDNDDHMPPDGKPQPSNEEITLLRWWIDAGASPTQSMARLNPPSSIARLLRAGTKAVLASGSAPDMNLPASREEIRTKVEQLSQELAVPISFLAETGPYLQANPGVLASGFGDDGLARMAEIGRNVRWLDLGGTGVTADGLRHLARFPNLTRLYLQRTAITDLSLAHLAGLQQLEYLNLHGTPISSAGLEHLKGLPRLRQLYLWQTQVNGSEARAFADAHTDHAQISEWEKQVDELKAKIRDAQILVDVGITPGTNAAGMAMFPGPINTECPVSGKPVVAGQTVVYNGKVVAFCCEHCKAEFEKDPKPFLSKLGLHSE